MMATFFVFIFKNLTTKQTNYTKNSSSSFSSSSSSSIFYFRLRGRRRERFQFKTKNPAGLIQQGLKIPKRSTFRELEALARTRLAVFFAFTHARIAREQSFRLQRWA